MNALKENYVEQEDSVLIEVPWLQLFSDDGFKGLLLKNWPYINKTIADLKLQQLKTIENSLDNGTIHFVKRTIN